MLLASAIGVFVVGTIGRLAAAAPFEVTSWETFMAPPPGVIYGGPFFNPPGTYNSTVLGVDPAQWSGDNGFDSYVTISASGPNRKSTTDPALDAASQNIRAFYQAFALDYSSRSFATGLSASSGSSIGGTGDNDGQFPYPSGTLYYSTSVRVTAGSPVQSRPSPRGEGIFFAQLTTNGNAPYGKINVSVGRGSGGTSMVSLEIEGSPVAVQTGSGVVQYLRLNRYLVAQPQNLSHSRSGGNNGTGSGASQRFGNGYVYHLWLEVSQPGVFATSTASLSATGALSGNYSSFQSFNIPNSSSAQVDPTSSGGSTGGTTGGGVGRSTFSVNLTMPSTSSDPGNDPWSKSISLRTQLSLEAFMHDWESDPSGVNPDYDVHYASARAGVEASVPFSVPNVPWMPYRITYFDQTVPYGNCPFEGGANSNLRGPSGFDISFPNGPASIAGYVMQPGTYTWDYCNSDSYGFFPQSGEYLGPFSLSDHRVLRLEASRPVGPVLPSSAVTAPIDLTHGPNYFRLQQNAAASCDYQIEVRADVGSPSGFNAAIFAFDGFSPVSVPLALGSGYGTAHTLQARIPRDGREYWLAIFADPEELNYSSYQSCGACGSGNRVMLDMTRSGCYCPGDADANGVVNFADITSVILNFRSTYPPGTSPTPGDADGNGVVNFADITAVLLTFNQPYGTACNS